MLPAAWARVHYERCQGSLGGLLACLWAPGRALRPRSPSSRSGNAGPGLGGRQGPSGLARDALPVDGVGRLSASRTIPGLILQAARFVGHTLPQAVDTPSLGEGVAAFKVLVTNRPLTSVLFVCVSQDVPVHHPELYLRQAPGRGLHILPRLRDHHPLPAALLLRGGCGLS